MKIESECFIDRRLWDLLIEIERRYNIRRVRPKKPEKIKNPVFDLFVRLGCANELIDRNGTFGWAITDPGLQLLRDLRDAYFDNFEDEDEEDDVND